DEALILLDGQDAGAGREERFGERPEAGADFQDRILRRKLRQGGDALDLVLIVQEILAERFGELNPVATEQVAHFRKLHKAAISSWSAVTAERSGARVMISGGVNEMTLACSPSGRKMKPRRRSRVMMLSDSSMAGAPSNRQSSIPAMRPRTRT